MIPSNVKIAISILIAPLVLGFVGLFYDPLDQSLRDYMGTHAGRLINSYAAILFSFMAGSFWGFTVQKPHDSFIPYVLSLLPVFLILSVYSIGPVYRSFAVMACLIVLLPIDLYFKNRLLAPTWWYAFKLRMTIIVLLCLFTRRFIHFIHATLGVS
jgi:hypothetical protein